jgi:hypothetical protein
VRPYGVAKQPCGHLSRVLCGTGPMIYMGSCPAAQTTVDSFSRNLAGKAHPAFCTLVGSAEGPVPAVWAGVLVPFQGCSEVLGRLRPADAHEGRRT